MNSKLFDEQRYKEEVQRHNEFLNSILGFIAFTLALTCLGFDHPQRPAMLCLAIIVPLYWQALFVKYPQTLVALRALAKETKDSEVINTVKYLEKKYHGLKALFRDHLILIGGLMFYIGVLVRPEYFDWFKI